MESQFIRAVNFFQIFVTFWYFFREAKFLKLFFIYFNSFIRENGFIGTHLKERTVLRLVPPGLSGFVKSGRTDRMESRVISDHPYSLLVKIDTRREMENRTLFSKIFGAPGGLKGEVIQMISGRSNFSRVSYWMENRERVEDGHSIYTVKSKDFLMRGSYLSQVATDRQVIDHFLNGGDIIEEKYSCVINQSGEEDLNKTFTRFIAVFPLILQARGYLFAPAVFTLLLYTLDYFSKKTNAIWGVLKDLFIFYVKRFLNIFPLWIRVEVSGILSSASPKFLYCDEGVQKIYKENFKTVLVSCSDKVIDSDLEYNRKFPTCEVPRWLLKEGVQREYFFIRGTQVNLHVKNVIEKGSRTTEIFVFNENYGKFWEGGGESALKMIRSSLVIMQQEESYPVIGVDKGYLHFSDPVKWMENRLTEFDIHQFIYKGCGKNLWVSQYSIDQIKEIKFCRGISRDISLMSFSILLNHNRMTFGEFKLEFLARVLKSRNGIRFFTEVGNKRWKKYVSDIDFIFRGEGKRILNLERLTPTKFLMDSRIDSETFLKNLTLQCPLEEKEEEKSGKVGRRENEEEREEDEGQDEQGAVHSNKSRSRKPSKFSGKVNKIMEIMDKMSKKRKERGTLQEGEIKIPDLYKEIEPKVKPYLTKILIESRYKMRTELHKRELECGGKLIPYNKRREKGRKAGGKECCKDSKPESLPVAFYAETRSRVRFGASLLSNKFGDFQNEEEYRKKKIEVLVQKIKEREKKKAFSLIKEMRKDNNRYFIESNEVEMVLREVGESFDAPTRVKMEKDLLDLMGFKKEKLRNLALNLRKEINSFTSLSSGSERREFNNYYSSLQKFKENRTRPKGVGSDSQGESSGRNDKTKYEDIIFKNFRNDFSKKLKTMGEYKKEDLYKISKETYKTPDLISKSSGIRINHIIRMSKEKNLTKQAMTGRKKGGDVKLTKGGDDPAEIMLKGSKKVIDLMDITEKIGSEINDETTWVRLKEMKEMYESYLKEL